MSWRESRTVLKPDCRRETMVDRIRTGALAMFPRWMNLISENGNANTPRRAFVVEGRFYPGAPLSPLEKWRMPAAHAPAVGEFHGGRGIGHGWSGKAGAAICDSAPPGEFFIWALPQIRFKLCARGADATQRSHNSCKLSALLINDSQNIFCSIKEEMTNADFWPGCVHAPLCRRCMNRRATFCSRLFPNTPVRRRCADFFGNWMRICLLPLGNPAALKELQQLTGLCFQCTAQQFDAIPRGQWLNHVGPTPGSSITEVIQTARMNDLHPQGAGGRRQLTCRWQTGSK